MGTYRPLYINSSGVITQFAATDSILPALLTVPTTPTTTASILAGAAGSAIRTGSGWLSGVLVITPGTSSLIITDGGAGNVIAFVQANQPAGWIPFPQPVPYSTSLYVNSGTNTPAVTVSYV